MIYLGTFSKSLGAGLRTGFAVFPDHLVDAAATAKALLDNGQVWLEQAAFARFMQGGGFIRHLRRSQHHYFSRRNALIDRLRERFGDVDLMGADAGTHCRASHRAQLHRRAPYAPASCPGKGDDQPALAWQRMQSFNWYDQPVSAHHPARRR